MVTSLFDFFEKPSLPPFIKGGFLREDLTESTERAYKEKGLKEKFLKSVHTPEVNMLFRFQMNIDSSLCTWGKAEPINHIFFHGRVVVVESPSSIYVRFEDVGDHPFELDLPLGAKLVMTKPLLEKPDGSIVGGWILSQIIEK